MGKEQKMQELWTEPVFIVRETEDGANRELGELAVEDAAVRPSLAMSNDADSSRRGPVKDIYCFGSPSEAAAFAVALVKRGVSFAFTAPHNHREQALVKDEMDQMHCPI